MAMKRVLIGLFNESLGRKILARTDWNINKDHKFNLRYSYSNKKTQAIQAPLYLRSPAFIQITGSTWTLCGIRIQVIIRK